LVSRAFAQIDIDWALRNYGMSAVKNVKPFAHFPQGRDANQRHLVQRDLKLQEINFDLREIPLNIVSSSGGKP
jgi:hypothetical protein